MTQAEVVMSDPEYKLILNILKLAFPELDTYVLTHYFYIFAFMNKVQPIKFGGN